MIGLDTSSVIAYLAGGEGADVDAVEQALSDGVAVLPAPVLAELLSDPALPEDVGEVLLQLPLLEAQPGFWERTGRLRASVLGTGRRARLADALIAQSCLDHDVPLLTRDTELAHVAALAGLRLVG